MPRGMSQVQKLDMSGYAPTRPHPVVLRDLENGSIGGLGSESSWRAMNMPQHITTMHSWAGSLPQAPGKLAHECADADKNTQTVGPLASLPLISSYKVKGILFESQRGGIKEGLLKQLAIWFRSRLLIQDPSRLPDGSQVSLPPPNSHRETEDWAGKG